MTLHRRRMLLIPCLAAPVVIGLAYAELGGNRDVETDPEINLALGRSYQCRPSPSYALCTEEGDATQLTDGKAHGCEWRRKTTVGWVCREETPEVLIDLGVLAAVDRVRVRTIGGGAAGVHYPANIAVLGSVDGQFFEPIGAKSTAPYALERLSEGVRLARPLTLDIETAPRAARYILVVFEHVGTYVFCDEIEVFRAAGSAAEPAKRMMRPDEVSRLTPVLRTRADIEIALHRYGGDADASRGPIWSEASRVLATPDGFSPERLEALRDALYAGGIADSEASGLDLAPANPMEQITPSEGVSALGDAVMRIDCWRGEFESAAVTVRNKRPYAVRVRVVVEPSDANAERAAALSAAITLRCGAIVNTRAFGPIYDALPRLSSQGFLLKSGEAGQVWLTLDSGRLTPGTHAFDLAFHAEPIDGEVETMTRRARCEASVSPLRMLSPVSLRTMVYPYVYRGAVSCRSPDAAIADITAHYANVRVLQPWGPAQELPMPVYRRSGVVVDFAGHRDVLEAHKDADLFLFFLSFTAKSPNLSRWPALYSDEWKAGMKEWLERWVEELRRCGIGYERFALYPYDEYIGEEFAKFARFVKTEVDPNIQIFANSRGNKSGDDLRRAAPYVDIWCFPDIGWKSDVSAAEREVRERAETWSYATKGPGTAMEPYQYYRLQMWRAFARGDVGCGFWCYDDRPASEGGRRSWDEGFGGSGPWAVVYDGAMRPRGGAAEGIVTSRRWEAWREGVEDYEYLHAMQVAIERLRSAGDHRRAELMTRVLDDVVADVLGASNDPSRVYEARRRITQEMLSLQNDESSVEREEARGARDR